MVTKGPGAFEPPSPFPHCLFKDRPTPAQFAGSRGARFNTTPTRTARGCNRTPVSWLIARARGVRLALNQPWQESGYERGRTLPIGAPLEISISCLLIGILAGQLQGETTERRKHRPRFFAFCFEIQKNVFRWKSRFGE